MKIDRHLLLYAVLAALPFAVALVVYGLIPEVVSIATGINVGTGRARIFILPAINLVFGCLIHFLFTRMDLIMRKKMAERGTPPDTSDFFNKFKIYLISFFDVMCFCSIYGFYALDWGGTATAALMCRGAAVMLGVGGLLVARRLPVCTKRSILSLRWSYTEKSDSVWYATHKIGGRLFYIAAIFSIACALLISSVHSVFLSALAYGVILFALYQYSKKLYFDEFR